MQNPDESSGTASASAAQPDSTSTPPNSDEPHPQGKSRSRGSQEDEDLIHTAFDAYPWAQDPKFMGLLTTLTKGGTQPVDETKIRLARISYSTRLIGLPINGPRYAQWLSRRPERVPPEPGIAAMLAEPQKAEPEDQDDDGATRPSWQRSAPKTELYVQKTAAAHLDAGVGLSDEPAYPSRFAQLIQSIQEGRPIPGVREIPSTLVRDPTVKPFGSRPVPRKPWEKNDVAQMGDEARSELVVDPEFPPLRNISPGLPTGVGAGLDAAGKETADDVPDIKGPNIGKESVE